MSKHPIESSNEIGEPVKFIMGLYEKEPQGFNKTLEHLLYGPRASICYKGKEVFSSNWLMGSWSRIRVNGLELTGAENTALRRILEELEVIEAIKRSEDEVKARAKLLSELKALSENTDPYAAWDAKLKPCPCCGSRAEVLSTRDINISEVAVSCRGCQLICMGRQYPFGLDTHRDIDSDIEDMITDYNLWCGTNPVQWGDEHFDMLRGEQYERG